MATGSLRLSLVAFTVVFLAILLLEGLPLDCSTGAVAIALPIRFSGATDVAPDFRASAQRSVAHHRDPRRCSRRRGGINLRSRLDGV
jgi:hypothetical protein